MNLSEFDEESREVIVTDIRMPFWSMVWFMVKLAIAAIPAGIILVIIYLLVAGLLAGIGVTVMNHMR
jgi:hypothetical protein